MSDPAPRPGGPVSVDAVTAWSAAIQTHDHHLLPGAAFAPDAALRLRAVTVTDDVEIDGQGLLAGIEDAARVDAAQIDGGLDVGGWLRPQGGLTAPPPTLYRPAPAARTTCWTAITATDLPQDPEDPTLALRATLSVPATGPGRLLVLLHGGLGVAQGAPGTQVAIRLAWRDTREQRALLPLDLSGLDLATATALAGARDLETWLRARSSRDAGGWLAPQGSATDFLDGISGACWALPLALTVELPAPQRAIQLHLVSRDATAVQPWTTAVQLQVVYLPRRGL